MLIADDMGVDRVGVYGAHPDPGRTPNIDALAARGVLFRNVWANPSCSPTRATLLTGRYGFRTSVGTIVRLNGSQEGLPLDQPSLPEQLKPAYHCSALGKWHLGDIIQGSTHPIDFGFDDHAGSLHNFSGADYFDWEKNVNGVAVQATTYATTDTTNDALRAIEQLPEPWFLYVAFNAPHAPLHAPPDDLHTYDLSMPPGGAPILYAKAMGEALDTEIGRLLTQVDFETTTVIFLGDNGTAKGVTQAPFLPEHAKATVYEGGVRVPLIVAGARVARPGSEACGLVNTTDLYATVTDLAGRGDLALDGISIVPYLSDPSLPSMRDFLYAERFGPNGNGPYNFYERTIRNGRYKYIERRLLGEREFYDLLTDPFELDDLLAAGLTPDEQANFRELTDTMDRLWATR